MKKLSLEEYVRALEKMKRSPRDRLGILGELGATGIGVTAGIAVSGAAAGVAGAATLAGSTTLASVLGGIFVTATPIGWVVGAAAAGGTLAYAATKAIRSGSKAEFLKIRTIREIEERIRSLRVAALNDDSGDKKIAEIITSVQILVANHRLTQEKGTEILAAVEAKQLSVTEAFDLLQALLLENGRMHK
jgi:hypothetical protein